jgi:uncharacterized membrane protein YozB (DUF420 family)
VDYSGIYHNTGCSISLELNLKISVMMLNLFLLPPIYATTNGITAVLLIAGVISIKMVSVLHRSFMTTAVALSMHFL